MNRTILILGASRYYLRAIQAAKAMGCRVVAVDRDPAAAGAAAADAFEPVDITDVSTCIDVARRHRVEGVLPLNDFGVPTAAHVAQELDLPGLSPAIAAVACSKRAMREAFDRHGVPSARFREVRTQDEARRAVRDLATWPLIVKPSNSRGGGSRGVMRISTSDELPDALEFAQSFYADSSVIIEECFEGSEHSVETITYHASTTIIAISDKLKCPPPYRVDKAVIYPTELPAKQVARVQGVVTAAIRAVGVEWGPVHVELAYQEDGPRVIELGARCGGGGTPDPIVPFVTGVEMLREVLRMSLGDAPGSLTPVRGWGCVYRFLTPEPGILEHVDGVERVRQWKGILDCDVSILPGQEIRPVRVGADRAGFVIAADEDPEVARRLAERAEAAIKFHVKDPEPMRPDGQ